MRLAPVLLSLTALLGCGKTGALRPPEPRGPLPPGAVAARQIGSGAEIAFTVPKPRGTAPAQEVARAEILRVAYPKGIVPPVDPEAFRVRGEVVAEVAGDPVRPGRRLIIADPSLGALGDAGIGWTLRYGVRVRDQHGRPSSLVVAVDVSMLAPAGAPRDVKGLASSDGVRLSWSPPPGVTGGNYNVYRGPSKDVLAEQPLNVKPLGALEYLDTAAETGTTYRYVVRQVLAEGTPYREGDSSSAILVDASDVFPPAAPAKLVAIQEGKAARLLWNPGTERDLDGYRVYRRTGEGAWARVGPDPLRQSTFLDPDVKPGDTLTYRVTAVDRANPPNESAPSDEAEVRIVEEPGPAAR